MPENALRDVHEIETRLFLDFEKIWNKNLILLKRNDQKSRLSRRLQTATMRIAEKYRVVQLYSLDFIMNDILPQTFGRAEIECIC